jgi:hypothetical protein
MQVVIAQISACYEIVDQNGDYSYIGKKYYRQVVALTVFSKRTGWRVGIPENHPALPLEACCIL